MARKALLILLTVAAFILLLCGAISYFFPLATKYEIRGGEWWIALEHGIFKVENFQRIDATNKFKEYSWNFLGTGVTVRLVEQDGWPGWFRMRDGGWINSVETLLANPSQHRFVFIHISIWLFSVLVAIYPICAFIRGPLRRRYRRKRGLCVHCGYSLIGNVSGRCSECGTLVGPSHPTLS